MYSSLFTYDQDCFIGYKKRGVAKRFICDKARNGSVLNVFKQRPFISHVYVEILRKVVKIATMECETESTETMVIFWTLLNEVLEQFTGKKGYKFNPKGWAVDEHGGN